MRTSQSKEKNNWIKPTQKPGFVENRVGGVVVDKEIRYLDKSNFSSSYYKKK